MTPEERKKELLAELAEIEKQEAARKAAALDAKVELFRRHPEVLHLMRHSRTSCCDANPCNEYGARCENCFLMSVMAGMRPASLGVEDFDLSLTVYRLLEKR